MIIAANYTVWDIQVYVLNVQCIFKPQQIRVLQNERRQTRGHFVSHDIPTPSASSLLPCTNRFTTLTPCWKVTLSRTNNRSVILVSNCFHSLQTTVNIPVCTNSVIVEQWGSSKVSIVPSPQAYEDSQCVLSADHTKVIRAVFYVRFIALTPCLKLYAFFWKTPVYIVIILSLSLITPNEAQKYVSL